MKKSVSYYTKVILWSYIVPGAIVTYIALNMKFDLRQLVLFGSVYFVVITAFNVFLATFSEPQNETQDLPIATTEGAINQCPAIDSPPSYQEAAKDPPPYSALRYYWKKIRKFPSRSQSMRSRSVRFHLSGDAEVQDERPVAMMPPTATTVREKDGLSEEAKTGLKRCTSSPY